MIIYRYILKSHAGPFVFALAVLIFLFLFQFLIKSIDQLVGKGLSIWVITKLISLNLAWILTLAVPMAVLVSTLMAFGTMAANNEITIMKAGGLSLPKLMLPVLLVAGVLCYLMVRFNNDILPETNHQARVLFSDISRTKPTLILEAGKFSEDIGGAKILVQKTFPNTNDLEGIYIYDYSNPNMRNLFIAEKGSIGFSSDFKNIVMNLQDGEIHQLNAKDPSRKYRKVKFDRHRIVLPSENFGFQQSGEGTLIRGDRELSAYAMNNIIDSLSAYKMRSDSNFISILSKTIKTLAKLEYKDTVYREPAPLTDSLETETVPDYNNGEPKIVGNENEINRRREMSMYDSLTVAYRDIMNRRVAYANQKQTEVQIEKQIYSYSVEIYKKYSIPFACIIFVMVGAPLGYRVKKGGFGIAAGLSLLFFLVYWASLIGGEKLADRGLLSPFLGMWLANIVLGIFGLYLMLKSS